MGALGIILRIVVYFAVVGGCSTALYGIVTAQSKFSHICPLFVSTSGEKEGFCKYIEFSAAAQLALGVLLAAFAFFRLARSRTDTNTALSFVELFFVVPAFLVALSGALIYQIGFVKFCDTSKTLAKDWDGCKSSYSKPGVPNIYRYLFIGELGMWVTCIWLFHAILSIVGALGYFRKGRESRTAIAGGESYKRMQEPI